ncbi:GGDEF domain-containing protein [Paenibacillus darwinianus]|nr:GGDEF domain-containing protein [Paenibacillus darwinianus]
MDEKSPADGSPLSAPTVYSKLISECKNNVIIDDISSHLLASSFIGVPVVLPDGRRCGTICSISTDRTFTGKDSFFLEKAAKSLACLIEMEDIIAYDELTDLYKRGYAETLFRHTAHWSSFAVAFLDLNDFKRINDTYGHEFGNAVLQHVGATLKRLSANGAFVPCRYAGDEFLAIFPAYSEQEDVLLALECILSELSTPVSILSQNFTVSASIGVCFEADSLHAYIVSADSAMYRMKQTHKQGIAVSGSDSYEWIPKSG